MTDKKPIDQKVGDDKTVEKKTSGTRRKVLKSVAIGGGLLGTLKVMPEKWSKPVIGSVVLPAHATASKELNAMNVNKDKLDYDVV
jgi:hypothetical protein